MCGETTTLPPSTHHPESGFVRNQHMISIFGPSRRFKKNVRRRSLTMRKSQQSRFPWQVDATSECACFQPRARTRTMDFNFVYTRQQPASSRSRSAARSLLLEPKQQQQRTTPQPGHTAYTLLHQQPIYIPNPRARTPHTALHQEQRPRRRLEHAAALL